MLVQLQTTIAVGSASLFWSSSRRMELITGECERMRIDTKTGGLGVSLS